MPFESQCPCQEGLTWSSFGEGLGLMSPSDVLLRCTKGQGPDTVEEKPVWHASHCEWDSAPCNWTYPSIASLLMDDHVKEFSITSPHFIDMNTGIQRCEGISQLYTNRFGQTGEKSMAFTRLLDSEIKARHL